jgi:hypothetical protein
MAVTYALGTPMTYMAGANHNTTYSGAAYLLEFGLEAEGIINTESQYNWSDWYTAYAATYVDVERLLVHCAACLGAIHIINCDMSGFTNIQEAVARINTLFEMYKRDIELLKLQAKKDFVRVGGGVYP